MRKKELSIVLLAAVISGLVGGALVTWFFQGQAFARDAKEVANDTVSAKYFRLVDDNGKMRAGLGFEENGCPALVFRDQNNKAKIYMVALDTSSMLVFNDNEEKMRAGIKLDKSGEFSVVYFDEKNRQRAHLLVNPTDGPKFGMFSEDGILRLGMQLHKNKQPMILLNNDAGKQEIALFSHQNFGPGLFLHDENGQPRMAYTNLGPVDPTRAGQAR